MKMITRTIRLCCLTLFTLIVAFLAAHSLFFTSGMLASENVRYLTDSPWPHLALIALLLAAATLAARRGRALSEGAERWCVRLVMLATLAASVLCVLVSKSIPIFDQRLCIGAADTLAAGSASCFQEYYLNYFPYQTPLVLFLSLFSRLGGPENFLLFQLLNVAANMLSAWALAECAVLIFHNRHMRLLTWLGVLAFLPLIFYTPFVYGNLYGLSFMLTGALCLLRYLDGRRPRHLVGMLLCLTMATLLKKNFLIAVIAACLILLMDALRGKRFAAALAAVALAVAGAGTERAVLAITRALSGAELSQGFPMSTYIMLGLQEEGGHEPGWYNNSGYDNYAASGEQTAVADAMARESIRRRLQTFAADPAYAASFFYRKTVSQWDEPSFQCLQINEVARNPERGALALSLYEGGKAGRAALWWMNAYHCVVWVGAALWLVLRRRDGDVRPLFFLLYIVGGFLFHTVWEAKGQYTIFYFVCVLPYAANGYLLAARGLCRRLRLRARASIG